MERHESVQGELPKSLEGVQGFIEAAHSDADILSDCTGEECSFSNRQAQPRTFTSCRLSLVALSAGTSVGIGIDAGLALSLSLNRLMARWIESGGRDPWMMLAVSLVLIAVAALACLIPARRATGIDPMAALRCE